jgi:hypothetical protein
MALMYSIKLTFNKENGVTTSLTVPYADNTLSGLEVAAAMEEIIDAEVIEIDGEKLESAVKAELIQTEQTNYVID